MGKASSWKGQYQAHKKGTDPAAILYSGGTSGITKGILLSNLNFNALAMKILLSRLTELKLEEHKENLKELKGDFSQITWGSQIRSYVFQPYTMVKDHRTGAEVGNVDRVMDGDLDYFINEKLKQG